MNLCNDPPNRSCQVVEAEVVATSIILANLAHELVA